MLNDKSDEIKTSDFKNRPDDKDDSSQGKAYRAKAILSKINDLSKIKLMAVEMAVLKSRYNFITEKIADQTKLTLTDWQKLADIELSEETENKIKCNLSRKIVVLFRDSYIGASTVAGLGALLYATVTDIFHVTISFVVIFCIVIFGSFIAAAAACIVKFYNMQEEEQENIAKLKVYQEGIEILQTLTSIEHKILLQAIKTYTHFNKEEKIAFLKINIIPPYIPKEFKEKSFDAEDQEIHFLLKDHDRLVQQVAELHTYLPSKHYEAQIAKHETIIGKIVKALNSIQNLSGQLLSYLGTLAATGGLWGGAMALKDSYDHEGSWKSPEALIILLVLVILAAAMSFWYGRHDTHNAAVHKLLAQMQKEFLKFQETYIDAVEATRYMLVLLSNPNALP